MLCVLRRGASKPAEAPSQGRDPLGSKRTLDNPGSRDGSTFDTITHEWSFPWEITYTVPAALDKLTEDNMSTLQPSVLTQGVLYRLAYRHAINGATLSC